MDNLINIDNLLKEGREEQIFSIIQNIETDKENQISILKKILVNSTDFPLKNNAVLLLAEYDLEDFVVMVIDEIKKNIDGYDIGTLIYSLLGKKLNQNIFNLISILCSLKPKYDNFEAMEMIKLVLEENNEIFKKSILNKSVKKIQLKLSKIKVSDPRYIYYEWCLNWAKRRRLCSNNL